MSKTREQKKKLEEMETEQTRLEAYILSLAKNALTKFDERYPPLRHKRQIEISAETLSFWLDNREDTFR